MNLIQSNDSIVERCWENTVVIKSKGENQYNQTCEWFQKLILEVI